MQNSAPATYRGFALTAGPALAEALEVGPGLRSIRPSKHVHSGSVALHGSHGASVASAVALMAAPSAEAAMPGARGRPGAASGGSVELQPTVQRRAITLRISGS